MDASQSGDIRHSLFASRVPRLVRRWLYAIAGAALVLGWVYGLWQAAQFRELTLAQSNDHLRSIAISVSQHLEAMINDGVGTAETAVRLADQAADGSIDDEHLGELLFSSLDGSDHVQALFVLYQGRYLEVSRTGIEPLSAPPEWLATLEQQPHAVAWAGEQIPHCATTKFGCMPVARKVVTSAGSVWAGAIFNVQSISGLHERLRLREGVVLLIADTGHIIARVPQASMSNQELNERAASAVRQNTPAPRPEEVKGPISGVPMVYQVSRVAELPLSVAVSMPTSVATASAQRHLYITLGLLSAGTAMLVLLVWLLRRSLARMEERESQIRVLLDASPLGILLTDGNVVIEANRAARELLGAPPGTKLEGMPLVQFAPPFQRDGRPSAELHAAMLEDLEMHGHTKFLATARRLGTGELLPVEVSLSTQQVGDTDFVLAIVRDLSDLERANEQLAQLNATLEHRVEERTEALRLANEGLLAMNRELESFASSASHDLRAPLTTISAMAGILREELRTGSTASAERRLERIQQAVQRMTEIIEGLLTLAGMTTQSLRCEEVDLAAVATQVAQELRQQYAAHPVEFECDAPIHVHADPRLMRTLLGNLLGNAWKYSQHTAQPRVSFRQQASATHDIEYTVSDNGAGFSMEQAEQLFQPFHRMHPPAEYPGIGLGLAIAQRVVHRYGGRIWAHGEPGRGAVFHFTLPAAHLTEHVGEDVRNVGQLRSR